MDKKLWRQFEKAVYKFIQKLDPSAEVLFDHKVPDRDTGRPRQCDVWVNATYGGHIPLTILISCKDKTRPLDVGKIETFMGEVRSTNATMGIIYSRSGFTKQALEKAKTNNINCCRLYRDEPADIPEVLIFEIFACQSQVNLSLQGNIEDFATNNWGDLFNAQVRKSETVLDLLVQAFEDGENKFIEQAQKNSNLPEDWRSDVTFQIIEDREIIIRVFGRWKLYRGETKAFLINGSYNFNSSTYVGNQISPAIDIKGTNLGSDWIQITRNEQNLPVNRVIAIKSGGNVRESLLQNWRDKPIG